MIKVFYYSPSKDELEGFRHDISAFIRDWNKSHSTIKVSSIEFTVFDSDNRLFPVIKQGSISYRELSPHMSGDAR